MEKVIPTLSKLLPSKSTYFKYLICLIYVLTNRPLTFPFAPKSNGVLRCEVTLLFILFFPAS